MVGLSAATAFGGDLTPPAGPVGPTMITLEQVDGRIPLSAATTPGDADSVFRITQPGSYYLTGNLLGVAGDAGIEIAASNVTVDLNGYVVQGVGGTLRGINNPTAQSNIVVRNGIVRDWGNAGIDLFTNTSTTNTRIENITASNNALFGIRGAANGIISNCQAIGNGSVGIVGVQNSRIDNCIARQNTTAGISAGFSSVVTNCGARGNLGDGFLLSSEAMHISNCSAYDNDGNGFNVGSRSTVTRCAAVLNDLDGYLVVASGVIRECTASLNVGDGIQVADDAVVTGNNCSGNGTGAGDGAGIRATGSDNRIDGNNVTDNDRGIDVEGAGNMIVRNTASGSTGVGAPSANFDFAAGNAYGPIFDVGGAEDINAADPATAHAFSNFEF